MLLRISGSNRCSYYRTSWCSFNGNLKYCSEFSTVHDVQEIKNNNNCNIEGHTSGSSQLQRLSIDGQKQKLLKLYHKRSFTNLTSLYMLSKSEFERNGGRELLQEYQGNIALLLQTIFPNYPWDFDRIKNVKLQITKMDFTAKKLKFKTLEDWKHVTRSHLLHKSKIVEELLKQYNNDLEFLLVSLYPDYFAMDYYYKNVGESSNNTNLESPSSFKFHEVKQNTLYFKEIRNQRRFMEDIFTSHNLKSLEEMANIQKQSIVKAGGKTLLMLYNSNLHNLLISIFPNYPWSFNTRTIIISDNICQPRAEIGTQELVIGRKELSIEDQRLMMSKIYKKLKLTRIGDWVFISRKKLIASGGEILLDMYNNNLRSLLRTLYPLNQFDFSFLSLKSALLSSKTKQRLYLNYLFSKFHLKYLHHWKKFPLKRFKRSGGKTLLSLYDNNFSALLSSIYSNYPWRFKMITTRRVSTHPPNSQYIPDEEGNDDDMIEGLEDDIYSQLQKMEEIAKRLSLISLDDWLGVNVTSFLRRGGKQIFKIYKEDMISLLCKLYPYHPWPFKSLLNLNFSQIASFKKKLGEIQQTFGLNYTFQLLQLTPNDLNIKGGRNLLSVFQNDLELMIRSLYPSYPWHDFQAFIFAKTSGISFEYFVTLHHKYIDSLKSCFDPLLIVNNYHFNCNYNNNYVEETKSENGIINHDSISQNHDLLRLTTINNTTSPNDRLLNIRKKYPLEFFKHLKNQRLFMDSLFISLKLNSLNEWLLVSRHKIIFRGGKRLLRMYNNDMRKLLQSVYPTYPWNFTHLKYRPNRVFHSSYEFNREKVIYLQKKYEIKEKRDWFRLNAITDDIDVFRALKIVYPDDNWKKEEMFYRGKKSNQRLLYLLLSSYFSKYILLENYRSTYLEEENRFLEIDIFIPHLNIAFEYHGMQHYDEIKGFTQIENNRLRDQLKVHLLAKLNLQLIVIPYWWNCESDSLLSFVQPYFSFTHPVGAFTALHSFSHQNNSP